MFLGKFLYPNKKYLNESDPEYTISSNVNTVDEDGGSVVFDISSNVRNEGQSIGYEITETAGVNNIEGVYEVLQTQAYSRYRIFMTRSHNTSKTSVFLKEVELINFSNQNVLREGGYLSSYAYSTKGSGATSNGPHDGNVSTNWHNDYWYMNGDSYGNGHWYEWRLNSEIYLKTFRNYGGTNLRDWKFQGSNDGSTWEDILDFTDYPYITNDDGWDEIELFSIEKSGTITPSAVDGSSALVVTMKTDSVVYDGNTFDITFSETGSEFKLDTDSDFTSDSITKTISMNDFSPVDYKVTSDVIQTTEGGSEINVTIEATNLSDIINVSRALNLSTYHGGVSIPSTVDITTISAGEHSGSFIITPLEDNLVYPDEVNITIMDPQNSSSTFLVNPDSENEEPVVGTGTLTINISDNDTPEYTISSNVNTVDEDGGIVIFDISSNVRKEGQSIGFEITEDSATDNIYDVRESMIGDFYSNISGWETQVDTYSDVSWQKLNGNGSMRMTSGHYNYVYVKKMISVRNGNNKIRINIPRIKIGSRYTNFAKNSKIMISILKDGVSLEPSDDGSTTTVPSDGFVKILDYPNIISEGYENSIYDEDHYYSGYIDHEFNVDDLDSTYEFRIGLWEGSSSSTQYTHVYIDSIEDMYASFTVNSDGKSGTITPLTTDGSTGLSVKLKTDSTVYNGNSFNVTFSQNGSKFKLDTESDFTSDSITKTININEFSPLDYKITSDVVQTTEGGSEINVTIEATNLSDIINVSRTLNLSVDSDRVSVPPTVDITTISAGEHSGSFVIDVITPDDNIIYPDEVDITITDPINSSSTFLVNPDSENEAPVVGTGTLTVTVIDNDVPEYTVSSNVNTVDEDGGVVVFDISSNVRKEGKSIGFQITETVGVDNIESVHGESFYDDFSSDISRWEVTLQSNWNWVSETYCNVVYDNSHNGTMRMDSRSQRWSYTETLINHDNSGTQTNKVRINIPHINTSNSKIYVSIVKDDTVIENTGYFNLLDTISSDFGVITANGDGTYSGYLEIDFTYDVDPNSEYKLRIGHTQINYNGYGLSAWDHVYIGDVNIYNVSQNLGKSGTITPSAVDGHAALTIKMKTDSVVSDGNTFDITFSESGSQFKLDTDSDFTSDSITKTININEQTPIE